MGKKKKPEGKLSLTIGFDQHLLLTHVLYVDCAVDDVLRRGAVIVLHLLALVALDLKGISCSMQQNIQSLVVSQINNQAFCQNIGKQNVLITGTVHLFFRDSKVNYLLK